MLWFQKSLSLPALPRGFHLITRQVEQSLPEISQLRAGLLHVFLLHTSASLSINENADPDVQVDLESSINAIVPDSFPFVHTTEGRDDMPAHVKSALIGCSVSIPIQQGRLVLGTWQGIYLCEHRNRGGRRNLFLTAFGSEQL